MDRGPINCEGGAKMNRFYMQILKGRIHTSLFEKHINFIFILKRLTGNVGSRNPEPGVDSRKKNMRDCM